LSREIQPEERTAGEDQEIIHCVDLSIVGGHGGDRERLEGMLWAHGLPAFERLDEETFSDEVEDQRLLKEGEVRWRFSFEESSDAARLASELEELFSEFDVDIHLWSRDVTGYRTAWKEYFKPYQASRRFVVHPPWDVPSLPEEQRIVIEPGMAFGTGTHQTTRLCLQLVDELADEVDSIFDVGTGSGILLIGAAKLGCHRLLGVDIDPVAVPEARRNADANAVGDLIRFDVGSAAYTDDRFDLVVANILPHIILNLKDALVARVAEAGRLLLSGIPWERRDEITTAFDLESFRLVDERQDGEWAALLYERTGSGA
jgi:ribosomal protein L11 methyltransferase